MRHAAIGLGFTLRDGAARLLRVRSQQEGSLTLRSGPQGRVSKGEALRTAFLLAAALTLSACAAESGGGGLGFGNVATDSLSPYYSPSTVSYAVRDGTMPTVIVGNPFAGPEEPVDEIVRNAARLPGWAPNTRFVPDANADAGKGHRVVVVLNPANQNLSPNAMCGADPLSTVTGGSFMVRTAFCQDALPLSTASVRRAPPSGRNDPAFAQAVAQAINLLFPFVEQRTVSVQ